MVGVFERRIGGFSMKCSRFARGLVGCCVGSTGYRIGYGRGIS